MSRSTRISTVVFDRLAAEGVIREGSRVYLWDGKIVELMPEGRPHANAVENLRDLVAGRLSRASWSINLGHPVELSDGYKPQPDLSVLRGPRSSYRSRTPRAADVALLVEISDTTYLKDSGEFLRQYALEGIPQYWIVNIPARRVEIYHSPDRDGATYLSRTFCAMNTQVPLVLTIDGEPRVYPGIDVAEILRDSLEEPS